MPVASLSSFVARTRFGTKLAGQTTQLATLVRKNGITLRAKPNISFRISILPTFTPSIHQSIHRPEFRLILGVNAFSVSSWLDEGGSGLDDGCSAFVRPERWPPPLTEPRREPNRDS